MPRPLGRTGDAAGSWCLAGAALRGQPGRRGGLVLVQPVAPLAPRAVDWRADSPVRGAAARSAGRARLCRTGGSVSPARLEDRATAGASFSFRLLGPTPPTSLDRSPPATPPSTTAEKRPSSVRAPKGKRPSPARGRGAGVPRLRPLGLLHVQGEVVDHEGGLQRAVLG